MFNFEEHAVCAKKLTDGLNNKFQQFSVISKQILVFPALFEKGRVIQIKRDA